MLALRTAVLAPVLLLVACPAPAPTLLPDPDALDLGVVRVGEEATAYVGLRNAGDDVVDLHTLTLAEGDTRVWSVEAGTADLFPGARAVVAIRFAPIADGIARGLLEVTSDDPGQGVLDIPLVGTGDAPGGNDDPPDAGCDTGDTGADDTGEEPVCGDADGDGHDLCDPGGDCDDTDPTAHPVVVGAGVTQGGNGTAAAPYATLEEALGHLDATCREVVLLEGAHAAHVGWDDGAVTVRGAGAAAAVTVTPPAGRAAFTVGAEGALTLANLTLTGARPAEDDDDEDHEDDGGALRVDGGAATLSRVRVVGNESGEDGGAIALDGGTLRLDRCTLADNTAPGEGGAVYAWEATVEDVGSTWTGNAARNGGALAVHESRLALTGSRFEANRAGSAGGAVLAREMDALAVERATFTGNEAGWRGGALAVEGTRGGLVRNTIVQGDRAGVEGGGFAVWGCSALVLANNTVVDTAASGAGGGLWLASTAGCTTWAWSNVVAYADGTSAVAVPDNVSVSLAYTLAWGDGGIDASDAADDGGNLVGDPLFARFSDDGTANDDLSLGDASPALDAGPPDGAGPDGYTNWADPDGTRNDRGHTGGPGAR